MTNPRMLVLDEATEGLAQAVIDKHLAPLLNLADRHYITGRRRVVWQGDWSARGQDERVQGAYPGV